MYLRQQFRAPHDSNGNPRRVWVLYQVKQAGYVTIVATRDEGYEGDPATLDHAGVNVWAKAMQLPSIDVPLQEYKHYVKIG